MQKSDLNIVSSFSKYKKESDSPIKKKDYRDINNMFMKFLSEKILDGNEVHLPAKLGVVLVTGRKRELTFDENGNPKLPPDWRKTKLLWDRDPIAKAEKKRVYCLNEHSGGVVYRIIWSKRNVFIENKLVYALRMTRKNKRDVNKAVMAGKEYIIKTENHGSKK
jgi:hypothetical protein